MLGHFRGSILFTLACLAIAIWYGWSQTHSASGALGVLWIVVILAVLEVSLSFDNAVVNATVLQDMDEVWRRRFLTWGMVFAVYGMYIVFPLAIVAVAAGIGPIQAVKLSLTDPVKYQALVSSAHIGIAGFGGAFLTMVALKYFFDQDKEVHWIDVIERRLSSFGMLPAIEVAFVLVIVFGISTQLPTQEAHTFLVSGLFGVVTFIAVSGVGEALEAREERLKLAGTAIRAGLGGFIYLNILDASFSFDAVIGAFALSNNMVVIALGLSIGAMFVRSLTLLMVKKGTLAEYRYLEHGAFWAILALGAIMLLSVEYEIPDSVTGLLGAAIIALALWRSVVHNRRHRDGDPTASVPG